MHLFKSLIYKHTLRYIIFISIIFVVFVWSSNVIFDKLWGHSCRNPVVDLEEIYAVPKEYNYFPIINLKLLSPTTLCIEGNQKFITLGSNKDYAYYDTVKTNKPDSSFPVNKKIFLKFLNSNKTDSLYLIISHISDKNIFTNQIFYSSVRINYLNKFSSDPEEFRLNKTALVNTYLLNNNDTSINQVINYFDVNKTSLGFTSDCGNDSRIFKSVCDKFNLPCRIIILQGGDSYKAGLDGKLGYPIHAICEIYSSRYKKWYIIDPLFGTVFIKDHVPQNAAEISDLVFAKRVSNIVQDSVLTSRSVTLQDDYFNYYRNVYYTSHITKGLFKLFIEHFYANYLYFQKQNTHKMQNYMDGRLYCALKTLMYLIISVIYIFIISSIVRGRLIAERNK